MSIRASEGLGRRLKRYRTLANMSARELADLAGYGLTRSVIANIESGRKTDLTVDQLLAIASVLSIAPVSLALPIDEPMRFVRVADGEVVTRNMRAHALIDWFEGRPNYGSSTDATVVAREAVEVAREYGEALVKGDDSQLTDIEERMRMLRIDPAIYAIDDSKRNRMPRERQGPGFIHVNPKSTHDG